MSGKQKRIFYEYVIDLILKAGGKYGERLCEDWLFYLDFYNTYQKLKKRLKIDAFFRKLGVKKVCLVWCIKDNPLVWLRMISLLRRGGGRDVYSA